MEIVAIAKFAEIFETAFLEKHARVSSFSQPEKIWRYIFYGGHFMNCQQQESETVRHAHKTVQEQNKQRSNWIRLIQIGKTQIFFFDLKRYFSLSKLIPSLFKSSSYNPSQNIWYKLKKCSKIGQDFKNVISNLACFYSYCQRLVSGRNTGHYSHFHNIVRLFDVSPKFPFTTSEAMRDYYL